MSQGGEMLVARLVLSALIVALSWLCLRQAVRARLSGQSARLLMLDAAPVLVVWLWLACLLSRPLLAAIVVAAMSYGLSRGDAAKRASAGEPLVFTDRVLASIFFYPSLYAAFVTPGRLVCGVAGVLAGLALLGQAEPALWASLWPPVLCSAALAGAWWWHPDGSSLLRWAGAGQRVRTSLDPASDAASLGPFSGAMLHAATASVERAGRRSRCLPGQSAVLPSTVPSDAPLVLLQLESFFDARRLGPMVDPGLLPEFDACVAQSTWHGRMATPAYGANTVRTEFAVLTGLSNAALGLDCFNPYADFARVPIDSIAWRLRAAGYRTVCIHPFDRRFYGRDRVIPHLGFDSFLDIGSFGRLARGSPYVSDMDVVRKIDAVLSACGPQTFVFAITMGNHSPWPHLAPRTPADIAHDPAFAGYLDGLGRTDAALGEMARLMRAKWPDGVLAAFGDHQPSFPRVYAQAGHVERSTDYVVLRAQVGAARRRDIQADRLPGMLLNEIAAPPQATLHQKMAARAPMGTRLP